MVSELISTVFAATATAAAVTATAAGTTTAVTTAVANTITATTTVTSGSDHLVGLVVKASASRVEDPGFESRLHRDFFGVESYQ